MNAMTNTIDRLRFRTLAAGLAPRAPRRPSAFTLVELMVVMAIMTVLSAMIAVAVTGAQESAKVSHTRAVIVRIHTLLMDRYESYRSRRLPIQIQPGSTPAQAAQLRCNAIRELMRMELPDRWTDITDAPVTTGLPRTAASVSYQAALSNAGITTSSDTTYQGADCLYLIVTMGLEENDVLENFAQGDIGTDPKNPKMQCFLDTWGNPIQFLRWAPGFNSPLQPANPTDRDQTDPTGALGSPPATFALYPLIYSAGPDGYLRRSPADGGSNTRKRPRRRIIHFRAGRAALASALRPSSNGEHDRSPWERYDNIHNQATGVH